MSFHDVDFFIVFLYETKEQNRTTDFFVNSLSNFGRFLMSAVLFHLAAD